MGFDFSGYILRNNFFQFIICLVYFLYPMIDKGDDIRGIPEGYDYAGTVLGMLQACAGAKGGLGVVHGGKLL